MKIKVADLLVAIDGALEREQAAIAEYQDARRRFDAQREQDWQKNVMPAWRALATMIRDKSKRRQKITEQEVNQLFQQHMSESEFFDRRNWSSKVQFWTEHGSSHFAIDGENYSSKPVPNTTLPALRRFQPA